MTAPLTGTELVEWAWDEWLKLLREDCPTGVRRSTLWQICLLFGVPEARLGDHATPTEALQAMATTGPLSIRARSAIGLIRSGELELGLDFEALDEIPIGDHP